MSIKELLLNETFRAKVLEGGESVRNLWEWVGRDKVSYYAVQEARKELLSNGGTKSNATKSTIESKKPTKNCEIEKTIVISDVHIPYQDDDAIDAMLSVVKYIKPSYVFLNGDIIDMYQFSRFNKEPNRAITIQEDLDELKFFLRRVRDAAPNAKIYYNEGNHEARLTHYLWNHPEISGLTALKPEKLFGLEALNIEWVPASRTLLHHGFVVTHGSVVRKNGSASAQGEYAKYGRSGISGHTHRTGLYRHKDFTSDSVWYEGGCLCRCDPEYVTGTPDWHQAFAVGDFIKDDDRFQISLLNIVNGKVLYDGKLFS